VNARALLDALAACGVRLWAEEGALRYVSPPGALTPALRDAVRAQREEVLRALAGPAGTGSADHAISADGALREAQEERAAILEHDAEMPRPEAESVARFAYRAWLYRLSDDPDRWLTLVTPASLDEPEARQSLALRFGPERIVEVRAHAGS
jgi:hypothetical protein